MQGAPQAAGPSLFVSLFFQIYVGGGAKKFTVAMARPTICPIGGLDVLFSNVPHTLCSLSGINFPSLYNKYNPSPSYLSASLYIMRDLSAGLSIDRVIF